MNARQCVKNLKSAFENNFFQRKKTFFDKFDFKIKSQTEKIDYSEKMCSQISNTVLHKIICTVFKEKIRQHWNSFFMIIGRVPEKNRENISIERGNCKLFRTRLFLCQQFPCNLWRGGPS